VRDPDGANDAKPARTSTLREDQVGAPFRHRNARLGEDGWALQVSRLKKGVALDFVIHFHLDCGLQLHLHE